MWGDRKKLHFSSASCDCVYHTVSTIRTTEQYDCNNNHIELRNEQSTQAFFVTKSRAKAFLTTIPKNFKKCGDDVTLIYFQKLTWEGFPSDIMAESLNLKKQLV